MSQHSSDQPYVGTHQDPAGLDMTRDLSHDRYVGRHRPPGDHIAFYEMAKGTQPRRTRRDRR